VRVIPRVFYSLPLCLLWITLPLPASSVTVHVPLDAPTIQAGIDSAAVGDTVLVAPGTYAGCGNCDDLSYGGKAIVLVSEGGPEVTVIDVQGSASQVRRAFRFDSGETEAAVLDGFTIQGGYARFGGGIHCAGASPTIRDCNFVQNTGYEHGGGLYCDNASPNVTECLFSWNAAGVEYGTGGGAVACRNGSSPIVNKSTFSGNSADRGAGVWVHSSSPTISFCVFNDNCAEREGAIAVEDGSSLPVIANCTLAGNTATQGSGLYFFENAVATVENCIIALNHVGKGVFCSGGSSPTLTCCDLFGNQGGDDLCGVDGGGNISENPLFCDYSSGDFALCDSSPCLPGNNGCSVLFGALDSAGCACPECQVLTVPYEYGTIGEALAVASYCDTVLVYAGTWLETVFLPWGVTLESVSGPDSTVIDGSLGSGAAVYVGYSGTKNAGKSTQPAVLDGFKITGGMDGAIKVQRCDPVITDCIIAGNSGEDGGGLQCLLASPQVDNCTFIANSILLYGWGGTIFCDHSSPLVNNCVIAFANQGPAVHCDLSSAPVFTCCDVYGNPGGDDLCGVDGGGNFSENPLFCDQVGGDLHLCPSSPCLPGNNGCGALVGALGPGGCACPDCAVLTVPYEYGTIGEALAAAVCCDTVLVYPGVYCEMVAVPAGVTLLSAEGPDSTMIDAAGSGAAIVIGFDLVEKHKGVAPPVSVDGFTIQGATDSGVKSYYSQAVISNCRFTGNSAPVYGGAIRGLLSSISVSSSTFSSNSSGSGGAIAGEQSCVDIADCVFSNNLATEEGGAVWCSACSDRATIQACTFYDNQTTGSGGAIYCATANLEMSQCVFIRNTAVDDGGGFFGSWSTSDFMSCTFAENGATYGGGIAFGFGSAVNVERCIVAFSTGGAGIWATHTSADFALSCSDVFGNTGGDYVGWWMAGQNGINGNFSEDPLFCDLENDDYSLAVGSPCSPTFAPYGCGLVGAFGVGCGAHMWHILPDGMGDAPSIQAGIDSASIGDTVLVAAGEYHEHDIWIKCGVQLRSESGPHETTIDAAGESRVFTCEYVDSTATIEGFTITGGSAYDGGGMRCRYSSARILSCVFSGNTAWNAGGGMSCQSESSPLIEDCMFLENSAGFGGALRITPSEVTIAGCVFSRNAASSDGGGVHCWGSDLSFAECTFFGNSSGGSGGAFYCGADNAVSVTNTIICFNGPGGSVYCDESPIMTLACSNVYGNAGGDWLSCIADQYGVNDNISEHPLFCAPENDNLAIAENSPCAPENSPPGCGLIGALDVGCGVVTSAAEEETIGRSGLSLAAAIPNPFNPVTEISYFLPTGPGGVRLSIYDTSGRLVKTLVDSEQPIGLHIVMWRGVDSNGIAVSSGVYFCRLEWEGQSRTRKVVLVR